MKILRKFLVTLSVAAGLLAIANLGTMLEDQQDRFADSQRRIQARRLLQSKLQTSKALKPQLADRNDRFRDSLTDDELNERNPFAELSGLEVSLSRLVSKGVRDFKRETYRSPKYTGEYGYDLVHYSIDQIDGTRSYVMAYLDGDQPVVAVVVGGVEQSEWILFRSGALSEKTKMPTPQAESLLERKINESVPFLSVSR